MAKKTAKKTHKKQKASAKKKVARVKPMAKAKAATRKKAAKRTKRVRATPMVQVGNQSVETQQLKPKARVARAGAGGGDFGGVSVVEAVDSESAEELLQEGQAYEAGIVSGVEDAPDPDQAEVTTHEVPQDDVPGEYQDKDRL
jgi:hypothetical protein